MPRWKTLLGLGLVLPLTGCPAFRSVERDVERTPVVNTGAGASIIYPGQSGPRHPGNQHPRQASGAPGQPPVQGVPPESASRSGGHGGGGVTMIGGTSVEEERHQKIEEAPQYWKYVTLPFAIVAAPFAYVYDAMKGEPEDGPAVPSTSAGQERQRAPTSAPPVDYETRQLEAMERELAERAGRPALASPPRREPATRRSSAPPHSSIAEELAALRGGEAYGSAAPDAATSLSAPPRALENPQLAGASGHVDRDGDGQTDHWIYRERGEISRELYDEDFDGRPDRTLYYDLATHQVARIEDDSNRDGQADTFTSLREGRVVGRRADTSGDGQVDTWTFYREGNVTRIERDASGDGFRDHVAHYAGGRLAREERDEDADGIPDLITYYDDQERVTRVEEDANGDGHLDVVSHYEEGRLKSRELRDASLLE